MYFHTGPCTIHREDNLQIHAHDGQSVIEKRDGDTVTVSCKTGSDLPLTVTCKDGQWDPAPPSCLRWFSNLLCPVQS